MRARRHGTPDVVRWSHDPEERFWKSIDRSGDCWLWTGALDPDGYGRHTAGASRARAHRHSYEMHHGPIPDGLSVLHRCDVRKCVNPAHLFLGSHTDNMVDMMAKDRSTRGVRNPRAKLTEENVRTIRERYAAGGISQRALGAEFGVGDMTVSLVVRRKYWGHIL